MEPRQSAPGMSFENPPQPSPAGEGYRLPEVSPENLGEVRHERGPETPSAAEVAPAPLVPVLPTPLPQDDSSDTAAIAATDGVSAPAAAADEDLIEKEWVDKAKKIIEDTKDDPYRRELEVSKLQREYIRKRYGREIGDPGE